MSTTAFPTVNDVGSGGATMTEQRLAKWIDALVRQNFVVSGLTVSSTSVLNVTIAAGEAIIEGYRVVTDATDTITVSDAATNYVYLQLTRDGSDNITAVDLATNTTGTAPADSVLLCTAVASGGSITSTTDRRSLSPMLTYPGALVVASNDASAATKAVADYVCDGTADEVEIQAAIDRAETVLLAGGQFTISDTITMGSQSRRTLVGISKGTVINVASGVTGNIPVIDIWNGQATVRDLIIYGGYPSSGSQIGIRINSQYAEGTDARGGSIVEGVTIWAMRGDGIRFLDSTGVLDPPQKTIIRNCRISGCGAHGINLEQDAVRNIIEGNICVDNTSAGIRLNSNSNNNIVRGNICYSNTDGIVVVGTSYNVIEGNICQQNGQNGINLSSASHNAILGNYCYENSQTTDVTYQNIRIAANSDYNNVQGNTCRRGAQTNKPQYGLAITSADCNANFVTNNDLYDSGTTGALNNAGTSTNTTAGNRTA